MLGTFATNLEGGFTATKIPEKHHIDWATVKSVAQKADRAGFEIQVPLARWASMGGETDFCGVNLEPMTWAAGLAEATEYSRIFATIHVPLVHPILAAKQMTTIDHISGGRFGVNVVVGWNPVEFAMFGQKPLAHDNGYEYAQEWIDVVNRLWTEDEPFDHKGTFFDIPAAWIQPKPLSRPRPAIMNAGTSPAGSAYAARNADIAFSTILEKDDPDDIQRRFDRYRKNAAGFGRDVSVWSGVWIICRDTEQEARDYYEYAIEQNGDVGVLDSIDPRVLPSTEGLSEEEALKHRARTLAAFGAQQLIGTPDSIAKAMVEVCEAGVDGLVCQWIDYEEGLDTFTEHVLPRLERAGVRKPFTP
ncbi:LLM class flavin-dependent oxidoreductase [Pseudonocardia lutea]|uniref:LLM class flavin-dependent oxidoreductase n=1 Tax=Pseudonocardia lutea TaxID=2172015 RepID=A0ABW1IHZ7_9PSEU